MSKFEIMDGSPVKGESIPVRIFLRDLKDLQPTMIDVANSFSVRYFLNIVLTDEEDRHYYKQQEICLYRRCKPRRIPVGESSQLVKDLIDKGQLKNFVTSQTPDVVETSKGDLDIDKLLPGNDEKSLEKCRVNQSEENFVDESSDLQAPDIMESCRPESKFK